MSSTRRTQSIVILLSVSLLTWGCAGTGSEPDGEAPPTAGDGAASTSVPATVQPVALRLAFTNGLADAHVEALQRELGTSGSGLELELAQDFDAQHTLGVEQEMVRAVADGAIDLAVVGARAFSELGVHDLDALVAPTALESVAAQEAVLATDLPDRMLEGLEPLGVTGLAVLPGPLRRPIAAETPLTTLEDFEGITFYTWRGDVNALSVEALGATNVDVTPEERNTGIEDGSIRAFENSVEFLADNPDWRTNAMTLNVNLWPSVSVLVANPDALAGLSADQLETLSAAVEGTVSGAARTITDEQLLVDQACGAGAVFAYAGTAALEEIEAALATVHDQLRTDPVVAAYLDEIEQLTADVAAPSPTVPDDCDGSVADAATDEPSAVPTGEPSELDGTYVVTWTVEDLKEALGGDANPFAEQDARGNAGTHELTIERGRFDMVHDGASCPGTVEVTGDRVILTATTRPSEWDCGDGLGEVVVDAAWELTEGGLVLSDWNLPAEPDISWFAVALLGDRVLERRP